MCAVFEHRGADVEGVSAACCGVQQDGPRGKTRGVEATEGEVVEHGLRGGIAAEPHAQAVLGKHATLGGDEDRQADAEGAHADHELGARRRVAAAGADAEREGEAEARQEGASVGARLHAEAPEGGVAARSASAIRLSN
jgi:hypothetical protein